MSTPPADLRARSIRGGMWAAAGAAGAAAVGLVNFLILSRLLGPEAYGLIAMVESALALGQRLVSAGLSEPLIQIPKLKNDHSDTLFWTLQVVAVGLTGAMIAASNAIGAWFDEPRVPILLNGTALSLYFHALGLVPTALLAREFRFRDTARASIVSEALGGAVALSLALSDFGVWALVVQRVVASAANAILLLTKTNWRPRLFFSMAALRDIWRFSASRGVEALLLYFDQHLPRILLGRVLGAVDLGYFIFARRMVENSLQMLNSPVRTTALSTFAALQEDLPRVRRTYAEGITLSATAILPACTGLVLVAPHAVRVLVGTDWEPSIPLLQLLALSSIRAAFYVWSSALLRGLGQPQLLLISAVLRTVTIALLVVVLLPWGAVGASLGILLGSLLSWPVALRYVNRAAGITAGDQFRAVQAPLAANLIMAAAVAGVDWWLAGRFGSAAMLAFTVATGVMVYTAAMILFGRSVLARIWHSFRVRS